jgi:predicted dehydrogenase
MKNICVIGAGGHSKFHCAALRELKAAKPELLNLAAICDLDETKTHRFQAEYGFANAYTDFKAMLASEQPDGIMVITPVHLTEKITSELLPLNIPLLIEKPAGINSEETKRLIALHEQYNTPHMVSMNRRFTPALLQATEWLRKNHDSTMPLYLNSRILRSNRLEEEFVTGTSIHLLDIVLHLLGYEFNVVENKVINTSNRCKHHYSCISFKNDSYCHCAIAPDTGIVLETHELHGNSWSLQIDMQNNILKIMREGAVILEYRPEASDSYELTSGHYYEAIAFLDLINGNRPTIEPTLQQALPLMQLAEQIRYGG